MRIKSYDRVIYQKNPIAEVTCQIRFPFLLSLEEESAPKTYQQQFANKHYPLVEVQHNQHISFLPSEDKDSTKARQVTSSKIFHFDNKDKTWRISIAGDSFTLTCFKYQDWQEYKSRFFEAFEAFVKCYPLPIIQRIGLRYKDIIDRSALNIEDKKWSELLAPFITGIFSATDFADTEAIPEENVSMVFCQTMLQLEDCAVLLRSGLLHDTTNTETAFLIDGDYYVECLDAYNLEQITDQLEKFHESAGAVFRCCIRRPLHEALVPRGATE